MYISLVRQNAALVSNGLTNRRLSLLKTLWEKEKMLVTSIFSYAHNVFYHFQIEFQFFSNKNVVVFKLDQSTILLFGKELNQSVENAGVAFVKGVDERNKFFENKRAMVALDCSPKSFSPQINSTSLFLWFQLVTLGVGPVLIPRDII